MMLMLGKTPEWTLSGFLREARLSLLTIAPSHLSFHLSADYVTVSLLVHVLSKISPYCSFGCDGFYCNTFTPHTYTLRTNKPRQKNGVIIYVYIYQTLSYIYIYTQNAKNSSPNKKELHNMSGQVQNMADDAQRRSFSKRGILSLSIWHRSCPTPVGVRRGGQTIARGAGRSHPPTLKTKWPPL